MGDLTEIEAELRDRFGEPPEEVEHLLALIRVRIRCVSLGMDSVVEREREIVLRPVDTAAVDAAGLKRALGAALRITPHSIRIRMPELEIPWQQALDAVINEVERVQRS